MKPAYLGSNAHTHSSFCDGKCTVEEMIQGALEKEFHTLGFSGHSPLENVGWCMKDTAGYRATVKQLAEKYKGRIDVVLGMEWDLDSAPADREGLSYVIGSVHQITGPCTGQKYQVDNTAEMLLCCRDNEFDGDGLAMADEYFDLVSRMIDTKPDILGHLDLIRKLNHGDRIFPEASPACVQKELELLEKAARAGILVELNTGGSYRGYRTDFYPANRVLAEFARMGGKLILTSDSHDVNSLGWQFEKAARQAKQAGFQSLWVLTGNGFKETEIE